MLINDEKKELCEKVFNSFRAVLDLYKIKLRLNTVSESGENPCSLENGILTVNLAELKESELESFIAYNIQKLILPLLRLETERMIVRRLEKNDFEDFFEIASNENIGIKDGFRPYKSAEEFRPVFQKFLTDEYRYAAVLKSENKLIGVINFREIDTRAVTAFEIGYDVNENFWRRGYAYEFLSAFVSFCIKDLKVDLITAGCFEGNDASMNLLRKLGFCYEGKLRKALYHGIFGASDIHSFYIEKE